MPLNSSPQPLIEPVLTTNQGIALIDKPSGISSHYVVNHLRHRFNLKRVGHAGTLDPLATGLLICLLGRDFTKLQDKFLKQPKVYTCDFSLGFTTDSYDRTGQKTSVTDWSKLQTLTQSQVEEDLTSFIGEQTQTVPAFSAVKVGGEKMYQKVLRNPNLDLTTLPTRKVNITQLELLKWQVDSEQRTITGSLQMACSSGTYVRSLIHDLGQKLGVGACVMELRRLSINGWQVADANKISDETISLYQDVASIPSQTSKV